MSQMSTRFFFLFYIENKRIVHLPAWGGHKYFRLDECVSDSEVLFTAVIVTLRLNGQSGARSHGLARARSLQLLAVILTKHVIGDSSPGVFIEIPRQTQLLLMCFFGLVLACALRVTVLVGEVW